MKTLIDKYKLRSWFDSLEENEKKILTDSCPFFTTPINAPFNSKSAAYFLANSLQFFNKKENVIICLKTANKVCDLVNEEKKFKTLELHFIYLNLIQTYYRHREVQSAFNLCIDICNRMIEIAPQAAEAFKKDPLLVSPTLPSHPGYEQLVIIEKKNKNWQRVIELCKQAKSQGWSGSWDKRIEEAKKHLNNA